MPEALPAAEKFTAWAIYRGSWYSVRSFAMMDEALDFAEKVLSGDVLITQDTHAYQIIKRVVVERDRR